MPVVAAELLVVAALLAAVVEALAAVLVVGAVEVAPVLVVLEVAPEVVVAVAAAPPVESLLDDPKLHPANVDRRAQKINPASRVLARKIISGVNPSVVQDGASMQVGLI